MKMRRLNNKGYMLVEIIFASVIAFGVAYFLLDLVIKLKNKNDDLLVDTLAKTDQAIITNTIMRDVYNGELLFCSDIEVTVDNTNHKITYKNKEINKETIVEVNKYTEIGTYSCDDTKEYSYSTSWPEIPKIVIPLTVTATKKSYDVVIERVPRKIL